MKKRIAGVFLVVSIVLAAPADAKEFLNTFLHINFNFLYGWPMGDVIDREERYSIPNEAGKEIHPDHHEIAFTIGVDLVPFNPIILGNESHAIKFGIRALYGFHSLNQKLEVNEGDGDVDYGGDLMRYNCWMVGPVIHYAPSIEPIGIAGDYTAGGGFTFFILMGQLRDGQYTAFPAMRDKGVSVSDYERTVTGWKMDVGCGAALAVCAINLGINIYYSMINFSLDQPLSQTEYAGIGKSNRLNEMCFELYFGIPIEWFVDPGIF